MAGNSPPSSACQGGKLTLNAAARHLGPIADAADLHYFKDRHHHKNIILQCVRWYVAYALSYRDLILMQERGSAIDWLWCIEPRSCDFPCLDWLADPDCVWLRCSDGTIEYADLNGDFVLSGLECAGGQLAAVAPLDASHGCFAKLPQSVVMSFPPVHPSP